MIALWLIVVACAFAETCSIEHGTWTVHWYVENTEFRSFKQCREEAARIVKLEPGILAQCQWEDLPL